MILCVTLNPCLDKTLTVPDWRSGDDVRGQTVREVVGGKGNNVARALTRLGRSARPATFLGGAVGTHCERLLREDDHLDPVVGPTQSATRVILTVRAESTPATAFFDPDPTISAEEAADFLVRIEAVLGEADAVTLSGSSPSPSTHSLYGELIAIARAKRIPAFLDTYGPPLDAIWGFWPQTIKLNRREAGLHLRNPQPNDAELFALMDRWSKHGVESAIVTDGPHSILALMNGRRYRATPPTIDVVNPIGSGDCMLAGIVDARLRGDSPEVVLRHAVGCAVANASVWDAGAVDPKTVAESADAVVIEGL